MLFYIFYLPRPSQICYDIVIATLSAGCIKLQVTENPIQNITISKCIFLVQRCSRISELADSVNQHYHSDPQLFLSNCYHRCCLCPQAGKTMAVVVPGITTKPKCYQRKMKSFFFFSYGSLLRIKQHFPPKALLQTSLHISLTKVASYVLLKPIIGRRNEINFRPSFLFL